MPNASVGPEVGQRPQAWYRKLAYSLSRPCQYGEFALSASRTGQPGPDPVEDRYPLLRRGDLDVDMAAARELLMGGQPERAGHGQVPALAHQLRHDRHRRGRQRRYLRSGPGRHRPGQRPAPAQLPAELAEIAGRPGVGFQLLQLQLEVKRLRRLIIRGRMRPAVAVAARVRLPDAPQRRLGYRPGPSGPGLDQQQLFFHTHTANRH